MQFRKPVQIIDRRFCCRNDIDAAEEKHQGKNGESDDDLVLHFLIDRSLSGSCRRRGYKLLAYLTRNCIRRFPYSLTKQDLHTYTTRLVDEAMVDSMKRKIVI